MVAAKMHSVVHRPANDCIPTVHIHRIPSQKHLLDAEQLLLSVLIIIICTAHKFKQARVRGAVVARKEKRSFEIASKGAN